MENRNQNTIYMFIYDENGKYHTAEKNVMGEYVIVKNSRPVPIKTLPANILDAELEFATNREYNSLNRSINYPLEFIKDGAAILRELYYLWKGIEQKAYLIVIEWDGNRGKYVLSYKGRFDFSEKDDKVKEGKFVIPLLDESAWGLLSQNDDVMYSIDCSASNQKAIKVLVDGITLVNTITFQEIETDIRTIGLTGNFSPPISIINEDGDSVNIVSKSQTLEFYPSIIDLYSSGNWILNTISETTVEVYGTYSFILSTVGAVLDAPALTIFFITSLNRRFDVVPVVDFSSLGFPSKTKFEFNFSFDITLGNSEKLYFATSYGNRFASNSILSQIASNISIRTKTKPSPQVVYALRPLDLLKEIVLRATNNRFTINSEFFTRNNKFVCLSGDSLRNEHNAQIQTCFKDFFKTFDSIFFMALRNIDGNLWIEEFKEVYKQNDVLFDLGECIDVSIELAKDMYFNEIVVGSPKQDYRQPSGRLEFNSENTFSIQSQSINKKLNLVTKYRLGCYDAQFLVMDYKGSSTKDNEGDKSVYVLDITDETGTSTDDIENFVELTINSAPLQPYIRTPFASSIISNARPTITGVAPSGSTVNVYADTVFYGTTTSDINGNWSYTFTVDLDVFVPGVSTGIHIIDVSFTDLSAPVSSVTITLDTTISTSTSITSINNNDFIYNNKPLLRGVSQSGNVVTIKLDGATLGTTVSDGSCMWTYQMPVMANGVRVIEADSDLISVTLNSNTVYPLVTSFELGFVEVNNLPLIEGVGIPGNVVNIYLNYISYSSLGSAVVDANGNWSFQVVPVTYPDPISGTLITLAPIQNGLNIISTALTIDVVKLKVNGFLLNRPNYSIITGVTDNTVFNTAFSPKRMLLNRKPLLSSVLAKDTSRKINFQTSDKNSNLSTTLNGVTISENSDIDYSELGEPLLMLEYANIKTRVPKTFNEILYNFNKGGIIKASFRGNDIFMLPIGNMKMDYITSDTQNWKLLMSPLNSYTSLLNIYKQGLTINLMKNSIYHSDYNSLHFVTYNFQQNPKYIHKSIYDDWFENRNSAWVLNPEYIQKFKKTDVIIDQIIANGVSGIKLDMYRCSDAKLVDTFDYIPVTPAPIPLPDVVMEATIDFSDYDEDQYFFVMAMNKPGVSLIDIPYQELITKSFYFTLSGTPTPGDVVTVNYYFNGSSTPDVFTSTVLTGWDIDDIITDLIAKINLDTRYSALTYSLSGNDGIRCTAFISPAFASIDGFVSVQGSSSEILNLSISERVMTSENVDGTILLECSNSLNTVGCFFSTGFKTVIRVEGMLEKLQPSISTVLSKDNIGNTDLLYGLAARKRVVRFGTAYGLPDYLYLRISEALVLDTVLIEGAQYTLEDNEKIEPAEIFDGHPLYYYNVNMNLKDNPSGKVFGASDGVDENGGVVLVVDAEAFGMPVGSLISIDLG